MIESCIICHFKFQINYCYYQNYEIKDIKYYQINLYYIDPYFLIFILVNIVYFSKNLKKSPNIIFYKF